MTWQALLTCHRCFELIALPELTTGGTLGAQVSLFALREKMREHEVAAHGGKS